MIASRFTGRDLVWLVLVAPLWLAACEPPDPARQVLEEATQAMAAVQRATYRYEYDGSGSLSGTYSGPAAFDRPEGGGFFFKVELRPSPTPVPPEDERPGAAPALAIASNGSQITVRDGAIGRFSMGTYAGGSAYLAAGAGYGLLFEFAESDPFADELAGAPVLEGVESINGVECDVVSFTTSEFGGARVTWYIGVEDRLPRGRDWVSTNEAAPGRFSFRMSELEINSGMTPDALGNASVVNDVVVDEDARPVGEGHPSPDWVGYLADGSEFGSADLAGEVAVIQVWASWCAACEQRLTEIARELEPLGDRIRLIGLNAWETREVDPVAWAADRGLPHFVVPRSEGASTLFKVPSPPAVFVVGPDGVIRLVAGPGSQAPAEIARLVREAVEGAIE